MAIDPYGTSSTHLSHHKDLELLGFLSFAIHVIWVKCHILADNAFKKPVRYVAL